MPSSITHYLVAQSAKLSFPEEIAACTAQYGDYYFLGAQGADALFFFRPLSARKNNLGRQLHNAHVLDLFRFFRDYLSRTEQKIQKMRLTAYIAGYLAHYAADVVFHPFVYNYLSANGAKKCVHQTIENDWDVYFLKQYGDRGAENFPFPFSSEKINREGTLADLFHAFGQRIKKNVPKRQFRRAIRNFERYLVYFHKNCTRRRKRWRRAEKIFGVQPRVSSLFPRKDVDFAFLRGERFEKTAEGRATDADGLFSIAVEETVRLVALFFSATDSAALPERDFNRSFHTGKDLRT